MASLRVGAGVSTELSAARATAAAAAEATVHFGDDLPNLVVAFASHDFHEEADDIAQTLRDRFPQASIIGCLSEGVIGGAHEHEHGPAVSVWAGFLPQTQVAPFALDFEEVGDGEGIYRGWPDGMPEDATLILLAEPFSIPSTHLARHLNEERPGLRLVGGVATGMHAEGEARLILNGEIRTHGGVAVAVWGRVRVDTLVSQGCRPIGEPSTITRADRNMIFELGGRRPVDKVQKIWSKATPRERALMAAGPLFIGRVVDERKLDFERGDFVVRPVVGGDSESGVIAVGEVVEVGETVQFHVLDAASADEDLREMLARLDETPAGVLLFACNGRGTNMFDEPDHDATAIQKALGGVPLAGFFANGELGPVGGQNYMHSFTASMALFLDTAART